MNTPKTIDRKAFLASCMAWAAGTLSGCGDDGGGPSAAASGGGSGGTTGGTAPNMGGTSPAGAPPTAGMSGATAGGMSGAGGATTAAGGMSGAGAVGASGGSAAVMFVCTTDTNNGSHSHPLAIPSADVDKAQDATYTLEDGGTGHTHTVEVTMYDFIYIRAGTTTKIDSSTNAGHLHTCTIDCKQS